MKSLVYFSVSNRFTLLVLAVLLMVAGFFLIQELPIEAFPDVSPNLVQVFTETEGLAPDEVEKFVSYPVEQAMRGLPGLMEIRSISNFGLSVVNIYFNDDVEIYFARQLVAERIDEARDSIPAHFGVPQMGPISTGMGLILFYYLEDENDSYDLKELRTIQDWIIKPSLQNIAGVTEVLGIGGYEQQYHVVVDPGALLKYNLDIAEITTIISENNRNVGAQFIEKNNQEFVVISRGLAESIAELEAIVVKSEAGTPVLLGHVAEIRTGGAVRRGLQTRNGSEEIIAGMVVKLIGTNSSTVISETTKQIELLNQSLPEGLRIVPYYEQRSIVQASVSTVTVALEQGIVLVSLVLVLFLGSIRGSLIAALSIPFSMLFAVIGMWALGLTANLMTLGGLAIAIGLLVDGAIVMIENIVRHLKTASTEATTDAVSAAGTEVARPVFFAILVVIIVFLPLFTLQGVEGKTFRPLAYSLALALVGALIYTLFVAPALAAIIMSRKERQGVLARAYNRFEQFTFSLYRPVLKLMTRRRSLALLAALAMLASALMILPEIGSEFTPELEEGTIVLRLTMAPSIALSESKRITMLTEQRLLEIPEVINVVSRIGRGEVGAHADPINSAEMYIELLAKDQWRENWTQEELEGVLREELGEIPGVLTNFTQPIAMSVDELLAGIRAELAIKVYGEDLEQLRHVGNEVAEHLRKVPGAADVQVDQIAGAPRVQINLNRAALARYGISLGHVQEIIHTAIGGSVAATVFEGVRRFDVLVRYPEEMRNSVDDISSLLVKAENGVTLELAQLADIQEVVGPRQIMRQDGQRFIAVQCNVAGRDIGSFVADAQKIINRELKLPDNYYITWGGQYRLQQDANARFAVVIPITLGLIVIFIYISLRSFRNTLIIMINIPLALVGGLAGLALTGENFSVPASIGFIALFGIAIGNGLVMITAIRRHLNDGQDRRDSIITAALYRLRPVLMTALTTAMGLAPLLFATGTGSEIQRPLAIVVVGGLITATIATLLILPSLAAWFISEDRKQTAA